MLRLERERRFDVVAPASLDLGWQRKDQIERDVLETGSAGKPHGFTDLPSVVGAMHPREHRVVKALSAKRETINSCADPCVQILRCDILRVRLDRHLCTRVQLSPIGDESQEPGDSICAQLRRRPAAEIQRVEGPGLIVAQR